MTTVDPSTGQPLPHNAIQRILFVAPKVHVYQIPPLTSTKGFQAGPWTAPSNPTAKQIFTARVRIMETSCNETIKVDILLEDASTGELFAAAPYVTPAVVQQAQDSSRFFAVRVVGDGGMKATLGIGFEERSEAFDFGISLGDEQRVLGLDGHVKPGARPGNATVEAPKQDFSLKAGQSIHIELGTKGSRVASSKPPLPSPGTESSALFSIAPPPAAASFENDAKTKAAELGFDDGEFGEFQ